MDKLLNPEVKEKFQKEIKEKLVKIDISNQSTNVSYNEIMTSAADITLGKVRKKKQIWITDELLDLCDERRRLKPLKKLSNENERK